MGDEQKIPMTKAQREGVHSIRELLADVISDTGVKIAWPVSSDINMTFALTGPVTSEQFDRVLAVIELARDSCVRRNQPENELTGKEPTSDPASEG